MSNFWKDSAAEWNVKEYNPENIFRSPKVEPGEFLSAETIYEEMGIGHYSDVVKAQFEFIGWYVNEKGYPVFGTRDDFLNSDQETAKTMYKSNEYISKIKKIASQYPI